MAYTIDESMAVAADILLTHFFPTPTPVTPRTETRMAEPFDPAPIVSLLDQSLERFRVTDPRPDYLTSFETRIAQAKAILDEQAHHANNVVPYIDLTPESQDAEIARLRAELATITTKAEVD